MAPISCYTHVILTTRYLTFRIQTYILLILLFAFTSMVTAYFSGRKIYDVALDRLDSGIVGVNPVQNVCVYTDICVLCCPVQVEALQHAYRTSENTCQRSRLTHNFKSNS